MILSAFMKLEGLFPAIRLYPELAESNRHLYFPLVPGPF
jgi:hypothetical protein